jgi:hypothetical protein
MGRIAHRAVLGAAVGLFALVVVGGQADGQVNFPTRRTKGFSASLVRSYDACTTPSLTVTSAGMPAAACPATNALTDDTVTMQSAGLRVTKSGKIRLLARGMTIGDVVRVRFTLRVTRNDVDTNLGSGQSVTFQDVTVDCPKAPDAFAVKLDGTVSARAELGACLAPSSALALGNVEILDAQLVDVINGRVLAAPGILHRP